MLLKLLTFVWLLSLSILCDRMSVAAFHLWLSVCGLARLYAWLVPTCLQATIPDKRKISFAILLRLRMPYLGKILSNSSTEQSLTALRITYNWAVYCLYYYCARGKHGSCFFKRFSCHSPVPSATMWVRLRQSKASESCIFRWKEILLSLLVIRGNDSSYQSQKMTRTWQNSIYYTLVVKEILLLWSLYLCCHCILYVNIILTFNIQSSWDFRVFLFWCLFNAMVLGLKSWWNIGCSSVWWCVDSEHI